MTKFLLGLTGITLLVCGVLRADVVTLQRVDLQYTHYEGTARDPLFPDSPPSEGYRLNVNLDLLSVVGLDSSIITGTDQTQFHYGGLQYMLYLRIAQGLEVGWEHESLHIFDSSMPQGYPLENAIYVRVKLYDANQTRKSLF